MATESYRVVVRVITYREVIVTAKSEEIAAAAALIESGVDTSDIAPGYMNSISVEEIKRIN